MHINSEWKASTDLNELMATLVAVFRSDGHLCNILTHLGRGNWWSIEAAIGAILAPRTTPIHLDPVARNLLTLICDARGITGPIMKAVFFGTIERQLSRHQAKRLKSKIRRLRRKVAAADLALQQQRQSGMKSPVQRQLLEQMSVATGSVQPSNPHDSEHSRNGISILHTPVVEIGTDGISVDAELIADGLGLEPAFVPVEMQRGKIRAVCERGIDADAGLYRLTFFRPGHRVRLVVDTDGEVRQRSSIAFGKPADVGQQVSV